MTNTHDYVNQQFDTFQTQLIDWLKIPSVSTDPNHKQDMLDAAQWLSNNMQQIGLENIEIMPTAGHPAVYADWLHAGEDAPTVLVYGHYDVQPADKQADGWKSEPFEPVVRDGKIYARGATDDKGQVMIQLKAAEALIASGNCPVNLKYLIEGEEEIGSPNLTAFVEEHADKLQADICLISDTGIKAIDQPSMVYGLRGLVTMEVNITGAKHDLHSGLAGGMVHNPAQAAAEIIAQLHDETGRVTVPGFYDDVADIDEAERQQLLIGDVTDEAWQQMMGDMPEWGEKQYSKIERTTTRPTLEINGIASGFAGEGFKTVLPAKAMIKISCRIVPNQDPDDIYQKVEAYIHQLAPNTVQVHVSNHHNGHPAITPIDHPATQAGVRAYRRNWEKDVMLVRGGGSIPIVAEFQRILDVPVVLLGFGLPDAQAHGPDENFYLEMYRKGINTVIAFMQELTQ